MIHCSTTMSSWKVKKRTNMKHRNSTNYLVLGVMLLLLVEALYPDCCSLFGALVVNGKEVEVTDEWHLLQEGETVPAGAHIKMDMSTGEKWVKKVSSLQKDHHPKQSSIIAVDSDGSISTLSSSAANTAVMLIPETYTNNFDDEFMMMYRVLSNLPPGEIGDGEVPSLPTSKDERKVFESQLREIWDRRQQTLVSISQSDDGDDSSSSSTSMQQLQLPKLLTRYIRRLRTFVTKRHAACYGNVDQHQQLDDEQEDAEFPDVLFILSELEYHLTDIDAARDFHTLGGWPMLAFLLSSPSWLWENDCSLNSNNTFVKDNQREPQQEEREQLQAVAAWALGNALKNHVEFAMWPLELIPTNPLELFFDDKTPKTRTQLLQSDTAGPHDITMISLLLDIVQQKSFQEGINPNNVLLPKALYALGSALRGNQYAQKYFREMGGALILGSLLQNSIVFQNYKLATKILTLAHDVLMEVPMEQHHMNNDDKALPNNVEVTQVLQQEKLLILRAFTGEQWCQSAYQMFHIQYLKQHRPSAVETVLRIVEPMIPHCEQFSKEAARDIIQDFKSRWSSSEVYDEEWRQELLELADSIESKLH